MSEIEQVAAIVNTLNKSIINTSIELYSIYEVISTLKKTWESDSLCTCKARVICTNATEDSVPHHMKHGDGLIHMVNIVELNKTNIEISENFEGCTKSPDGKCYIAEKYKEWIADEEWKSVDESSSQGEGKEKLNKDTSYMVCIEHSGIIYFCDDGQELQPFINGEALLYLSNDYLEWLKMAECAEGFKDYPHIDSEDSKEAKDRKNVTLGIGFTFDIEKRNWDVLRKVLHWSDEKIEEIINELYDNNKDYSGEISITYEQAVTMTRIVMEREYIPDLNAAIKAYNAQQNQTTTYSQRELEAMLDYSYNNGLSADSPDGKYSTSINNSERIIYYYLRKDQTGAVEAVKRNHSDARRRLNQMNLFFNPNDIDGYNFLDKDGTGLEPLRNSLGF